MNDFFNLIGDFFQNRPLTNEEQILLAILGVLLFLLGYLVGWLIQRSSTRRYKRELLVMRKDRDEYEARYRDADTKQKATAKELETVSREKVDLMDQTQGLRNDLAAAERRAADLASRNEQLETTQRGHAGQLDALNERITGLQAENETLRQDLTNAPAADSAPPADTPVGAPAADHFSTYVATTEARLRLFEERLAAMAEDNARLRQSSAVPPLPPPSGGGFTGHQPVMNPNLGAGGPTPAEPLVIRADTTAPGARTGAHGETEVIVATTPSVQVPLMADDGGSKRDDLTLIDGVGPFLQGKLNEQGVYRFEQIAAWTAADVATYTELIGYVPGLIDKNDWVGQARALSMSEAAYDAPLSSPMADENMPADEDEADDYADPAAATLDEQPKMENVTTENDNQRALPIEDNLRIVEGIGPKIEGILKEAGVTTLSQLAETPPERLREILDEAGSRFRSHNPKTWPVQAGLAADGKLVELKAWQDELKGGR